MPIDQITLTVNPAYRYGASLTDDQWSVEHGFGNDVKARFRTDTCEELISYTIGCMIGRYGLDRAGLVHAHAGNEGFDPGRLRSFPADDDALSLFRQRDLRHRFPRADEAENTLGTAACDIAALFGTT